MPSEGIDIVAHNTQIETVDAVQCDGTPIDEPIDANAVQHRKLDVKELLVPTLCLFFFFGIIARHTYVETVDAVQSDRCTHT